MQDETVIGNKLHVYDDNKKTEVQYLKVNAEAQEGQFLLFVSIYSLNTLAFFFNTTKTIVIEF